MAQAHRYLWHQISRKHLLVWDNGGRLVGIGLGPAAKKSPPGLNQLINHAFLGSDSR